MPTPMRAMQNDTTNTEVNAFAATARIPNASSGPSIAPTVSRARCTPNAAPSCAGGVDIEIIASRGAVRIPLPMRSIRTSALIADSAVPAVARPILTIAESP